MAAASSHQLVRAERRLAQGHIPVDLYERLEAQAGTAGAPRLARRTGPDADPETSPPRAPPARQQHAEAGLGQQRRRIAQEGMGAGRVEVEPGGV